MRRSSANTGNLDPNMICYCCDCPDLTIWFIFLQFFEPLCTSAAHGHQPFSALCMLISNSAVGHSALLALSALSVSSLLFFQLKCDPWSCRCILLRECLCLGSKKRWVFSHHKHSPTQSSKIPTVWHWTWMTCAWVECWLVDGVWMGNISKIVSHVFWLCPIDKHFLEVDGPSATACRQ